MDRPRTALACAVLSAAILLAGCSVGDPKPATYVTDISATLNGDVYSDVQGNTKYWFKYGKTSAYGSLTPQRTIAIADDQAHPVSEPIAGLAPATTYHWQMCVRDGGDEPPRDICSSDRAFLTGPAGGRSGFALVRYDGPIGGDGDVYVIDANGSNEVQLTDDPASDEWVGEGDLSWSPDARRIALSTQPNDPSGGGIEVYVMSADGGALTPLTGLSAAGRLTPDWSPDGTKIAYRGSLSEIWVMNADGSDQTRVTTQLGGNDSPDWSPDGRRIAFRSQRDGNYEIYAMSADGTNQTRLTTDPGWDISPAWSPDGRKIAFVSNRISPFGVYVMNADGTNPTRLTPTSQSATSPSWSPDGTEIAFAVGNQVMVMNADGTNPSPLATLDTTLQEVTWSPRP